MYEISYLVHHGIKGMHWGVRRSPEELGYKPSKKKKHTMRNLIQKAKKTLAKPKGNVSAMSDEELRQAVARLDMEKRYKDLQNYLHPKKESFVKKVATGVLKGVGEVSVKLVKKGVTKLIDEIINGEENRKNREHDQLRRDAETMAYRETIARLSEQNDTRAHDHQTARQNAGDDYEDRRREEAEALQREIERARQEAYRRRS